MKIALVQLDIAWESKRANFEHAEVFIKRASQEGCRIVVFPEMFNTGFSMNISAIAEDEDGETASFISKMAKEHSINIIAGYASKGSPGRKGRNIAVAYNRKGKRIVTYAKIHPFSFAEENGYYSAGDEIVTFTIEGVRASIFICYDLRFPEVFRCVAQEVQAIFIIANWPAVRKEHWTTLLRARAIENQCIVIGVNRIGKDGNDILYSGASSIFGPSGKEICSGNETSEFITGEMNAHEVIEERANFPFLKDRRPFDITHNRRSSKET